MNEVLKFCPFVTEKESSRQKVSKRIKCHVVLTLM